MTLSTYVRAASPFLMLGTLVATASAQSASEILAHVSDTYSHAKSVHIVVKRDEVWTKVGQSSAGSTELEIALRGSRNYFARSKSDGQESLAISDGEHTWKAVPSKKQWTQVAAAAMDTRDGEGPDPRSQDLYSSLTLTLAGRYIAIAKLAEDPQITGEEDLKVEGRKIPCYVIRARTGSMQHDLWIDRERFVVLQHKEKGDLNGMHGDIHTKVIAV